MHADIGAGLAEAIRLPFSLRLRFEFHAIKTI
jgi:hypothetical protein